MTIKHSLLLLIFSFSITNCEAQKKAAFDSVKVESQVVKTVLALTEVQQLIEYNKAHKSKYPVVCQIRKKPDGKFKYYWIGVGNDGEEMFTTYLHFYVNPNNFEVKYFDVFHNSVLSLKQWRADKKLHKADHSPH